MENKKLTRTAKFDFIIKAIFSVWLRRFEALETDNRVIINKKLKLFKRILAFILIGNTDAHLKNFAMFHNDDGSMSLTPIYDIVAVAYYPQFNTLALEMNGTKNLEITQIKPKTIVDLALNKNGFNLTKEQLLDAVKSLEANILNAVHQINSQDLNSKVKRGLVEIMEKRWNGAFKGVQNYLTKRKKN